MSQSLFRIENELGNGPYRPYAAMTMIEAMLNPSDPLIRFARKLGEAHCGNPDSDHICGGLDCRGVRVGALFACPTYESLQDFFKDGFFEEALELGYRVMKYTVSEFVMGDSGTQAAFYPADVIAAVEV